MGLTFSCISPEEKAPEMLLEKQDQLEVNHSNAPPEELVQLSRASELIVKAGKAPIFINGASSILSLQLAAQLEAYLPEHMQGHNWMLLYSLLKHGASITTFLEQVRYDENVLLVLQTLEGEVFGGYSSTSWHPHAGYFGTGEAWVYKVTELKNGDHNPEMKAVQKWGWTGMNTYFMKCTETSLAMGGGGCGFAFFVDEDFFKGTTSASDTFGNQPLASDCFSLANIEIWGFTMELSEVAARVQKIKERNKKLVHHA